MAPGIVSPLNRKKGGQGTLCFPYNISPVDVLLNFTAINHQILEPYHPKKKHCTH